MLRNGPAKFEVGGQGLLHWFDGFAMVHRFTFAGGRVAYANRFLQSRAYREALVSGKLTQREFATSPVRSRWQRFIDFLFPQFTDNCSVNILPFGRETVALTETPAPSGLTRTRWKRWAISSGGRAYPAIWRLPTPTSISSGAATTAIGWSLADGASTICTASRRIVGGKGESPPCQHKSPPTYTPLG